MTIVQPENEELSIIDKVVRLVRFGHPFAFKFAPFDCNGLHKPIAYMNAPADVNALDADTDEPATH